MVELLIIVILLGLIPAAIAQRKGESFVVWWIYGALLFIVALPHALLKKPNVPALEANAAKSGMKKCPYLCGDDQVRSKGVSILQSRTSDDIWCRAAAARERGAAHSARKRTTEGTGYLKRESA